MKLSLAAREHDTLKVTVPGQSGGCQMWYETKPMQSGCPTGAPCNTVVTTFRSPKNRLNRSLHSKDNSCRLLLMFSAGKAQSPTLPRTWTTNMPTGLSDNRVRDPATVLSASSNLPVPASSRSLLNVLRLHTKISGDGRSRVLFSERKENTALPGCLECNFSYFSLKLKAKTFNPVGELLSVFATWRRPRVNQTASVLPTARKNTHQR